MAPARFARTFLAGNEARSNSKQQLNINEQRTRGSLVLLGRRLCPFPFQNIQYQIYYLSYNDTLAFNLSILIFSSFSQNAALLTLLYIINQNHNLLWYRHLLLPSNKTDIDIATPIQYTLTYLIVISFAATIQLTDNQYQIKTTELKLNQRTNQTNKSIKQLIHSNNIQINTYHQS